MNRAEKEFESFKNHMCEAWKTWPEEQRIFAAKVFYAGMTGAMVVLGKIAEEYGSDNEKGEDAVAEFRIDIVKCGLRALGTAMEESNAVN